MKNNEFKKSSENLLIVLSNLKDKNEIFNFLKDLLTEKEILEFSKRFEVAQMLENNISYIKIEKKTSMSSKTIARVSKFLNGENNGYKNAISILKSLSDNHHTGHQT